MKLTRWHVSAGPGWPGRDDDEDLVNRLGRRESLTTGDSLTLMLQAWAAAADTDPARPGQDAGPGSW